MAVLSSVLSALHANIQAQLYKIDTLARDAASVTADRESVIADLKRQLREAEELYGVDVGDAERLLGAARDELQRLLQAQNLLIADVLDGGFSPTEDAPPAPAPQVSSPVAPPAAEIAPPPASPPEVEPPPPVVTEAPVLIDSSGPAPVAPGAPEVDGATPPSTDTDAVAGAPEPVVSPVEPEAPPAIEGAPAEPPAGPMLSTISDTTISLAPPGGVIVAQS
jgi:hypothetical protein